MKPSDATAIQGLLCMLIANTSDNHWISIGWNLIGLSLMILSIRQMRRNR